MYFTIKGYSYNNNYKRPETERKSKVILQKKKQEQEAKEYKVAMEEYSMREPEKIIPYGEGPNVKAIDKIAKEINQMKRCGESRERIDREMNPEVHKITRRKQ